jgi:hypothetical protein
MKENSRGSVTPVTNATSAAEPSESVHRAAYREYFTGRGWQVEDQVIREFTRRRAPDVFATLAGPWKDEDPSALTKGVPDALRDDEWKRMVCVETCNIRDAAVRLVPGGSYTMTAIFELSSSTRTARQTSTTS